MRWTEGGQLTGDDGGVLGAGLFQFLLEVDVEDAEAVANAEEDAVGEEAGHDDDPGVQAAVWNDGGGRRRLAGLLRLGLGAGPRRGARLHVFASRRLGHDRLASISRSAMAALPRRPAPFKDTPPRRGGRGREGAGRGRPWHLTLSASAMTRVLLVFCCCCCCCWFSVYFGSFSGTGGTSSPVRYSFVFFSNMKRCGQVALVKADLDRMRR